MKKLLTFISLIFLFIAGFIITTEPSFSAFDKTLLLKNSTIEYSINELNDGTIVKITVSTGIAAYPNAAEDELTLMDFADKALYESKHNGKNCVHLYEDSKFIYIENKE